MRVIARITSKANDEAIHAKRVIPDLIGNPGDVILTTKHALSQVEGNTKSTETFHFYRSTVSFLRKQESRGIDSYFLFKEKVEKGIFTRPMSLLFCRPEK